MRFVRWLVRNLIAALVVLIPFGIIAYFTGLQFSGTSAIVALSLFAIVIPLLALGFSRGRRTASVRFSSLENVKKVRPTARYRVRHFPLLVRVLAVTCFLIAFAMPRKGDETTTVSTRGIAIQMVVDHSGSMRQEMRLQRWPMSRLDAVKRVFKDFVLGSGELRGRKNDMIGLTSFAAFVEDNCPLTLDHDNLINFVDAIDFAARHEDGTAIGDAIYHAALSLISAEGLLKEAGRQENEYSIESKIMILLTDGENNAGLKTPAEAARFAQENEIKIYTILISSGAVRTIDTDLFGRIQFPFGDFEHEQAVRDMKQVADITGGRFEEATSGEALQNIYRTIDRLERTEFEQKFLRYHERFQFPVFAGLSFLVLEIILRTTWLRRVP
ncbi:MAG: VWA domain-containing protein [bacterium]|nr:VWA domain-containing protein [bacterium]